MALHTKSESIIYIKSQFGTRSELLDMVGMECLLG